MRSLLGLVAALAITLSVLVLPATASAQHCGDQPVVCDGYQVPVMCFTGLQDYSAYRQSGGGVYGRGEWWARCYNQKSGEPETAPMSKFKMSATVSYCPYPDDTSVDLGVCGGGGTTSTGFYPVRAFPGYSLNTDICDGSRPPIPGDEAIGWACLFKHLAEDWRGYKPFTYESYIDLEGTCTTWARCKREGEVLLRSETTIKLPYQSGYALVPSEDCSPASTETPSVGGEWVLTCETADTIHIDEYTPPPPPQMFPENAWNRAQEEKKKAKAQANQVCDEQMGRPACV
jgi:hypothetical protein